MNARQPDWQPQLRVFDSDLDPGEPTEPAGGSGRPISIVPCAVAAALAVLAVAIALPVLLYRSRTVVSQRLLPPAPVGAGSADSSGCPRSHQCSPVTDDYGALPAAIDRAFPDAELLYATALLDTTSNRTLREIRVVRTTADPQRPVTVSVTAQCVPGASDPVRASSSGLLERGPVEVVLLRPTRTAGCGVAVVATVPAGAAVPLAALRQLAEDADLEPR